MMLFNFHYVTNFGMGFTTSTNTDNLYKEGTLITAKAYPDEKLTIMRYYHRIYYCSRIDNPDLKQLVYFERELIPPGALS